MSIWGFGLTMLVMGMIGTLLTLYILSFIIRLMNRLAPYKKEEKDKVS